MINIIDVVILFFAVCFILHGVVRGFIRELIAVLGLCVSTFVSIVYAPVLFQYLPNWLYSRFVAFIICFVVLLFLFALLGELLSRFVRFVGLSFLNATLGGVFGLIRTLFWVMLVLFFLNYFQLDHYPVIRASVIFHLLSAWNEHLFKVLPHLIARFHTVDTTALTHVAPLVRV